MMLYFNRWLLFPLLIIVVGIASYLLTHMTAWGAENPGAVVIPQIVLQVVLLVWHIKRQRESGV